MEEITKAQEEVLKALWKVGEGAVGDILDALSEPKPAYNTVATVIKVLEKKGYVSHKTFGKTHVFYPLVSRRDYAQSVMKETFKGLYQGSLSQVVSFFMKSDEVSLSELEELKNLVEKEIEAQKKME